MKWENKEMMIKARGNGLFSELCPVPVSLKEWLGQK